MYVWFTGEMSINPNFIYQVHSIASLIRTAESSCFMLSGGLSALLCFATIGVTVLLSPGGFPVIDSFPREPPRDLLPRGGIICYAFPCYG